MLNLDYVATLRQIVKAEVTSDVLPLTMDYQTQDEDEIEISFVGIIDDSIVWEYFDEDQNHYFIVMDSAFFSSVFMQLNASNQIFQDVILLVKTDD